MSAAILATFKGLPSFSFLIKYLNNAPAIKPSKNLTIKDLIYVSGPYPESKSFNPIPTEPDIPPTKPPHRSPARIQTKFPKCTLLVPSGICTYVPTKVKAVNKAFQHSFNRLFSFNYNSSSINT